MDWFADVFYFIYLAVTFFYLGSGVILFIRPQLIAHYIKPFFPLLYSFKYGTTTNSLNLIFVGIGLLMISEAIQELSFTGFFCALLLSALEVYLGFKFYYFEQRDMTQAVIHVVLHALIVVAMVFFISSYFAADINHFENQGALLLDALLS